MSSMWPEMERVSSQLPPPRSTSKARRLAMRAADSTPRWIRRPSSRPEMTSTFQPVAVRTQSRKARLLRASRSALVATTRTRSAPCVMSRAMKSPQHAQGVRHRLGIERSVGENALAQACDFAVFVESFQAAVYHLGYFQPDRVRTDVNRGECWHAKLDTKSISYESVIYKGLGLRLAAWRDSTYIHAAFTDL